MLTIVLGGAPELGESQGYRSEPSVGMTLYRGDPPPSVSCGVRAAQPIGTGVGPAGPFTSNAEGPALVARVNAWHGGLGMSIRRAGVKQTLPVRSVFAVGPAGALRRRLSEAGVVPIPADGLAGDHGTGADVRRSGRRLADADRSNRRT